MSRNFLYNNVSDEVREELDARKVAQGATNRTTSTHNWSTRKMAYAKVTNIDADVTLAPPAAGGFTDLYSDTARYVPDPVLTSVSLRNEGKMGSLQKATVSFTVFNRDQIDKYEPLFLTPGINLKIEYGWSVSASDAGVSKDTFEGIVYDFSMALTNFGGFECTVEVVGKGFKLFGIGAGASVKDSVTTIDSASETKVSGNLVEIIDNLRIQALGTDETLTTGTTKDGFVAFEIPTSGVPVVEEQTQERNAYITLQRFFGIVNQFITEVLGEEQVTQYVCDSTVTISQYDPNATSGDVRKVILPDSKCGKYGEVVFDIDPSGFKGSDEIANLNNILLNIKWLTDRYKELVDTAKEEITINAFINDIFSNISVATGGIYNLTLITREDEGDSNIYVIDTNYTGIIGEDPIKPFIFQAFKADSIVRTLSLDSKLPDRMATAMYIGGRGSNASGINADTATNITEKEVFDPDENIPRLLNLSVELYGNSGFQEEQITAVISGLKKYKIYARDKNWSTNILYPLNLSVSIDGVAGLRFGNVVGTNWLPSKYRDKLGDLKVIFVITNVSHTISNNNWVTSIETQCRMSL